MPNALVTEEERQKNLKHQKAYRDKWKARDPEGFRRTNLDSLSPAGPKAPRPQATRRTRWQLTVKTNRDSLLVSD